MASTKANQPRRKQRLSKILWAQRSLLIMSVPFLLYRLLFSYVPLAGWIMAFQDHRPRFGTTPLQQLAINEFVGLDNFRTLLNTDTVLGTRFVQSVINTFGQALLTQIVGFICAIGLSLLINEVRQSGIKRIIQNVLYLPHFLSWVIVASLASVALALPASGGIINEFLLWARIINEPILFLANPGYFWGIVAGTHLWRNLGWNTIIYLAAMTAVDPSLYEAADIDGASRYRKMWHITLSSIKPTIVILLIMNTGWLLTSGFEIQWFLGHGVNISRSENIDIFILRYGIQMGNFSLATAAGILRTGISITLLAFVNFIAGKLGQEKLF